ncbi:programmed cell death 1 ligand 1-like, partial [Pundamilia nyererei]|uniref:Programmed cell death 1 ligand 1-like n=1 Tax=Pundamilia nyererei TaxID=303518 RepID=A0A9Y3VWG5_9CICH
QKTITAESGQNVTLPCRALNNNKILTVEWHRPDLQPKYVLLFRDGNIDPDNQHPSFKNRVDLQDRKMKDGNVSLILKNVTINDAGTYECQVFLEETHSLQSITNITLSVDPPGQRGGSVGLKGSVLVLGLLFVVAFAFAF